MYYMQYIIQCWYHIECLIYISLAFILQSLLLGCSWSWIDLCKQITSRFLWQDWYKELVILQLIILTVSVKILVIPVTPSIVFYSHKCHFLAYMLPLSFPFLLLTCSKWSLKYITLRSMRDVCYTRSKQYPKGYTTKPNYIHYTSDSVRVDFMSADSNEITHIEQW